MSKIPPQNLEAESSLLGALLIDKEAIIKVGDALRPADFYKESHGLIYQAILDLFEKHEPADILSVGNRLAEKKQLDGVGGKAYLAELTAGVPNSSHVVTYSEIIRKKSTLRKLERAASEISEFSFSEDQDVSSLLDRAEQKLFSISQESLKKNFIPIKSVLTEAFNRIDELHKSGGKGTRGIPSGFSDLDNKLSGFQNSDLIILAVKPQQAEVALGNLPKAKIDQVFLSIMTGVSIKKISNLVNSKKVARVMPNTPARIGSGMSVWTAAGLFKAEKSFIKRILQSLGQELEVSSEDLIDKATAVSGSGPAYVFDFASHLIVAAQELGFNEKQARQLVGQTIIGAGSLLIMSEESASDLRKKVTSKGGTTEAAFKVIDKAKLNKIYSKALKVAYKRARELRGGI